MKKPALAPSGMLTLLVALAVATFPGTGKAAGPFGSPSPLADEDSGTAYGIGYFFHEAKWKPDDPLKFGEIKVEQDAAFLHLETLFSEESAGFLRIGAATLNEIDDSFRVFGSVGYRGVWFGDSRSVLEVGPVLIGSYHTKYKDRKSLGAGIYTEEEVKGFWDAGVAVALQKRLGNRLAVFGGPFGYYGSAKAKVMSPSLGIDASTTLKDKNNIGAYAGARYTLFRGLMIEAEGQFNGNVSFGVTAVYSPR